MIKFYSISTLRENLDSYLKQNSYTNCKKDLCDFFKGKSLEDIFNNPILLAPNNTFRYIKSRITNSNFNIGKSGCYRLYYYVDLTNKHVYLLGYYPKTGKYGRGDLTNTEEKLMIKQFKAEKKSNSLVEHNINDDFKEVKPEEVEANSKSQANKKGK